MMDLNPNAPPPAPAPTPHKPAPSGVEGSPMMIWVAILICLAAFAGGLFVANLWEAAMEQEEVDEGEEVIVEEDEATDEVESNEDAEEVVLVSTDSELVIDWMAPDDQPSYPDNQAFNEAVCKRVSESGDPWLECETEPNEGTKWSYKLGTVKGSSYDGRDLIMTVVPFMGMGMYNNSFYLLVDPDAVAQTVVLNYVRREGSVSTLAERFGEEWPMIFDGFVVDMSASIPEFSFEQIYHDTEGNEFFFTTHWERLYSDKGIALTGSTRSVTRTDGGTLRLYEPKRDTEGALLDGQTATGENQLFDVDEDGLVLFYDLRPPFFNYGADKTGLINSFATGTPLVRWNEGNVSNDQVYFKGALGGCGFSTLTNVVSDEVIATLGLQEVGEGFADKGSKTYPIYEPASYDIEYYEDAFTIVTWEQEGEEPKTYDDFDHPFFYYQDALGRWVEFMSNEIVPPMECGKPVIYLYPESTMDMSVWVKPRGGFSYTEPEYGDGWDVTAYPDGRIVNREDGLEYQYLFWEGRGGLYSTVETYWVVEQLRVESFLRETLTKMNFNPTEIEDFVEFWLPRMQEDAYYKIGFHGTNVMNQLAPLSLSVKPDNVFRILMDYEGLETWQPSNPPARLPRANRDGFEVMEWGGVLR